MLVFTNNSQIINELYLQQNVFPSFLFFLLFSWDLECNMLREKKGEEREKEKKLMFYNYIKLYRSILCPHNLLLIYALVLLY